MLKMKCRRWSGLALGLLAVIYILIHAGTMTAQASENRVLKVAFPEMKGISETDQYGRHTGLMVDYLNEIAKYTGWEYEYIPTDGESMIDEFMDGQYDLMGGTFYSPAFEEYFAYPDYNMGRSRAVLLCRRDDDSLRGYDLTSINGKTVGVYDRAGEKIRYLNEFLNSNNLECNLRYYTYEDLAEAGNLYEKLRTGEVDMLLGNDLEIGGEFRMVASFPAQPYYIVTTVGNTELLEELNTSLQYILESVPGFADEAYYSNFPDVKNTDIQLNDRELQYIKEKGSITVAVPKDWHPFCCHDKFPELHEGILTEILDEISTFTGLTFNYVYGENYADCIRMVQEGKADILGTYLGGNEQAFADKMALSQPYMNLNNIVLKHKSVNYPEAGLTAAVLTGQELPASFEAAKVHSYDTVPEMLKAVNTGEVDYVYGISAMLEQEMQNHRYLNVVPVTREIESTDIAFAIPRPVPPELLTVLNKAVGNLSSSEKAAILSRNVVSVGYSGLSLQEMVYANPVAFILILTGVLILVMTVILLVIRSRMKDALMQSRLEAAEAKSMAKSGFLSQMSHEIRTPMNAIVGLTDLTCMEQDVPPEIEKKLKKIHSSSRYLLSLINDILDMSRIENGKMELEQKEFSLSAMLDDLQEMMSVQAEQKNLQFSCGCNISHDWLSGDPVRLRQILTNLLSNAVKFTPDGGMVRMETEEISCDGTTASYRFSVQDTGVGIAKEEQERVFTAFEQLRPAVSYSAGTGLGLPISRSIAKLMGGDLEVTSEPGKGSVFYMTLTFPLAEKKTEPEPETRETSLEGIQVLLAEDNDLNAEIAQELLAMQGVAVRRAVNGQEAVELFTSSSPGEYSAVLMDIRMPVMNGHEAAREIRTSGRKDADVPIIAMTANTFKEDEEAARAAGMDDFVPKPIEPARLFTVLRKYAADCTGGCE